MDRGSKSADERFSLGLKVPLDDNSLLTSRQQVWGFGDKSKSTYSMGMPMKCLDNQRFAVVYDIDFSEIITDSNQRSLLINCNSSQKGISLYDSWLTALIKGVVDVEISSLDIGKSRALDSDAINKTRTV